MGDSIVSKMVFDARKTYDRITSIVYSILDISLESKI